MRTHTSAACLAITGLLALPACAPAGGWATVGLSSTPDGLAPGTPWNVDIEVLQHGRTPLVAVHPTVTITSADEQRRRTFATHPAGRPGVYRASVTFPRAGRWRYVVDDGFTATHPYPPVQIGGAGATTAARGGVTAGGGGVAFDRLGLAALAGLAAAGLALAPGRRRSRRGTAREPAATAGG
jgi:hypothetical protein